MSMMDVMNQGGQAPQPEQAPPPGQPPQAAGGQDPLMRMGEDGDLQALVDKFMGLISTAIWKENGADQVAEQLMQDDSAPAEIIGKYTGFYMMMAVSAAKSKGGMPPPIVVAGVGEQTAEQLTDLALSLRVVSPEDADDTADAATLIGLEVLLQNASQAMAPEELQEYVAVAKSLIEASPEAQQIAEENTEEAVEDAAEMQGVQPEGTHQMPDGSTMADSEMPEEV